MDDGWGIHSASATKELGTLEQTHVGLRIEAVLAACASGRNQAKDFPGAKN
jgi:hypothetical protein